jgi:radical SAM protein with 4Fe4S-binding SPASM domain
LTQPKKFRFTIAVSLDGTKFENNKIRKFKDNSGTFNQIVGNIKFLREKGVDLNTLSLTLTKENINMNVDSFMNLTKKLGFKRLRVEPDMTKIIEPRLDVLANKIMKFEKIAKLFDIELIGYWKKPYYNLFLKRKNLGMAFCSPYNGEVVSIQPSGNIALCIYDHVYIDNIDNLIKNKKTWNWGNYLRKVEDFWIDNLKSCDGCEIEGLCLGGCHVSKSNLNDEESEFMCDFYRTMTKKLITFHSKEIIE